MKTQQKINSNNSSLGVLLILCTLILALSQCGVKKPTEVVLAEKHIPEIIDYNLHVKPILSDRCFACHGPDKNKRKADLRLDTPEGAYMALSSGNYALKPGSLSRSEVYHRIISEDPELLMPPLESNLSLTPEEIAVISRWIEQGAVYKPHWAFIAPEKPKLPEGTQTDWTKSPIDQFILARLNKEGLKPSPQADKATLLRRLSLDLTGLPPNPEQMEAFTNDTSPNAYENAVDRLLDSPHFGERMASDWLDLARYADTHGYQDDGLRNMWPWRDWVINAFNRNIPYDQFVTWQLAGDLLEKPTDEMILATAFNRNHMQTQEGGVVPEEFRVEYVADRTNTLGKAFLGLTLECARCHDHKYDPLSQEEYFSMFAFFNQVNETGQIPYAGEASPTLILKDDSSRAAIVAKQQEIKETEALLAKQVQEKAFQNWLKTLPEKDDVLKSSDRGLIGAYSLDKDSQKEEKVFSNTITTSPDCIVRGDDEDRPKPVPGKFGEALEFVGDGHIDMGKKFAFFERNEPFSISFWTKLLDEKTEGPLFSRTNGLLDGNRGYEFMLRKDHTIFASLIHVFPDNALEVQTKEKIPTGEWVHLMFTYDGSSKAQGIRIYLNGKALELIVKTDNLQRSILHYGPDKRNWSGSANLHFGRRYSETLSQAVIDEIKVFDQELTPLEVRALFEKPEALEKMIRDKALQKPLKELYAKRYHTDYQNVYKLLKTLRAEENELLSALPEIMVMNEIRIPRKTFILDRGQYDAPTTEVSAKTPESILAYPKEYPKNRLGLAKWLFHPDHPLTSRVVVNRYWQLFFGQGLVGSSDDFGNQGALPTHPELLDWLATEFQDSGWNIKAFLKTIVMSATYQQSSKSTAALLEKDPANQLLARGPRFRLSAEMVRDHALAVSGLLVKKIGGPSVYPYQPPGLWKELATRNATVYEEGSGEDLYRRGLYTIWKRTSPPPSMISFDASERNFCTVKRQNTNTPLQALVLLNDPQYVEAARFLAERMMREGGKSPETWLAYGFRLACSRQPDQAEVTSLMTLYRQELDVFEQDTDAALELLGVGEKDRDASLPAASLAALTMAANVLLSFDEAVIRR